MQTPRLTQNMVIATLEDPGTVEEMAEYFLFLERVVYPLKKPFVIIHDKRTLFVDLNAAHRWGTARHLIKHAFFLKKYLRGIATVVRPENIELQHAAERGLRWQVSFPFPTLTTSNFEEAVCWGQRLWWLGGRVREDDDNPEPEKTK